MRPRIQCSFSCDIFEHFATTPVDQWITMFQIWILNIATVGLRPKTWCHGNHNQSCFRVLFKARKKYPLGRTTYYVRTVQYVSCFPYYIWLQKNVSPLPLRVPPPPRHRPRLQPTQERTVSMGWAATGFETGDTNWITYSSHLSAQANITSPAYPKNQVYCIRQRPPPLPRPGITYTTWARYYLSVLGKVSPIQPIPSITLQPRPSIPSTA